MSDRSRYVISQPKHDSQSTDRMAASSHGPTGYNAQFDPPLDKKHECPLCLYALRDPIQAPCGHRFCTSCIKNVLLQAKSKCPLDNEPLRQDEIFPDNFCRREVLSLTVLCSNKESGCSWKGRLKELEKHDTTCDYTVVTCNNEGCDSKVSRMNLQTHLTDCKFRLAACRLCKQEIVLELETEHHQNECPEFEVLCENTCGQYIKRKDYSDHCKVSCQWLKEFDRQFASVGCQFEGVRSELRLSSEHTTQNDQLKRLSSTVDDQNRAISDLCGTVRDLTLSLKRAQTEKKDILLNQEVIKIASQVSALYQQHIAVQGKVTSIEQRQLMIERNLAVRDNAFAEHDVRLLSLEMTFYDGVLRWKITEFSRKKREAVAEKRLSIYSPPFFTSRTGYKMCARIYLNGDGLGKNTHVSLFIVIMKGEFDALLPWPFQQRVTFTLIDQERRHHLSDTFQPDPASSSFQRPVNDMNVASGCPLFVSLDTLLAGRFIKDDTMFVRIAIDTRDLDHL